MTLCGGLTGARKIAAMAEAHEIQIVPHNPLSPICLAASLHLDAAIGNFAIQEYPTAGAGDDADGPLELRGRDLVTSLPELGDGMLAIPTAPGLGMALVPDVARLAPAIPRPVSMRRHADGSLVDQ